jgi:FMN-dependent NADH-azoreductase
MKLLHIDAGITGPASVSRRVSAAVVDTLAAAHPGLEVVSRDLDAEPIPHLGNQALAGLADNEILAEFLASDMIVVGAPMYNFGIASSLKAWLDHILVAGKTFRYTPEGPVGLAGGKRVVIASARGGVYAAGAPMAALDFQEPYLRTVFRFIGIDDVTVVRAEGVAISPDHRANALKDALAAAAALETATDRAIAA